MPITYLNKKVVIDAPWVDQFQPRDFEYLNGKLMIFKELCREVEVGIPFEILRDQAYPIVNHDDYAYKLYCAKYLVIR